ncbi:MAG: hypothetical protein HY688_03205 [Chloroflexi bacterium]|nr:hypothetical protein [Chloroflexota bacterium]
MRAVEERERPVLHAVDQSKRQVLLMEYEILDSYWTHHHQWIWLSGMVLIGLSMLGITFLPVGLSNNPLRGEIVTFVGVIAGLLILIWWGLVRQMLGALRIVHHRKKEIEKLLGMRMELYLSFARAGRRRQRVREMVQEEAGEDPELRADLADFLRTPGMRPGFIPGEEWAWNLLPVLFLGAWAAFWAMMVIA